MTDTLSSLIADLDAVADEAERRFGGLQPAALHWRPGPSAWSVGQCLEHLVVMNSALFPALEAIGRGTYRPPVAARLPLLPRLWGRFVLHAVRPETSRRSSTRATFNPAPETIGDDIVTRFRAHQRALAERMKAAAHVDLHRTCVVSPMTGAIAYSLLDAYRIIVAHERRHLTQSVRVTETAGFPALIR